VSIDDTTRIAETVLHDPSDGLTSRESGMSRAVSSAMARM
jgi:hypothetical protein